MCPIVDPHCAKCAIESPMSDSSVGRLWKKETGHTGASRSDISLRSTPTVRTPILECHLNSRKTALRQRCRDRVLLFPGVLELEIP